MFNFADMMRLTIFYKRLCLTIAFLAIAHTMAAYTDHRNTRVDSAEQVLHSNKKLTDKERMECYYQIVRGTLGKDTEKHNRYCHLMLALSYKIDAKNMRESALYHLGLQHYGQDDFAQAERYFKWALEVTDSMTTDKRYTEADIDDNRSQLYGALGNLYNLQDKALLAIDYYQKALPIFERHGWLQSQTILHHNVAELWLSMGNNRKAEQEYLRAIEAGEASGDSLMMALPRKGLVKIYIDEENYDKAKQTLQLCHNYYYAHRYEEPGDYPEVLASLVKMHLMEGHVNLPKARSYAKEALAWVSDDLMAETRFDVYAANAMVEMRQNRWHEALGFALQSVHENDEEATFTDVDSYEMLSQIYMQLGDKAKAREYMQKTINLMNRYATNHYQSGLSQMQVLYETEKKEAQIAALDKEQRLFRWLLVAAVAAIVLLAVLVVYRHIAHKRQKSLLAARVALETETKERRILARDLHDGLGGMLTLLRLKSLTPDHSPKGEGSDYLKLLDATIEELRRVSHHLMPEELLRNGLASALHDFAVSVPGAQFQNYGHIALRKEMELTLYRCAYELVNNAMKHAHATHINIQLVQAAHEVTLTVSDDGRGYQTPHPSEGVGGGSAGLQNIRERIEPYNGTLRIVTNENEGSEINISLPL